MALLAVHRLFRGCDSAAALAGRKCAPCIPERALQLKVKTDKGDSKKVRAKGKLKQLLWGGTWACIMGPAQQLRRGGGRARAAMPSVYKRCVHPPAACSGDEMAASSRLGDVAPPHRRLLPSTSCSLLLLLGAPAVLLSCLLLPPRPAAVILLFLPCCCAALLCCPASPCCRPSAAPLHPCSLLSLLPASRHP